MRIVLDTNVFIAAALKSGFARDIVEFASAYDVILITSEEILDELRDKLFSKFDKSETIIDLFINKIRKSSEIVKTTEKVSIVRRDPEDNKILECAVAGRADLIVSADQDLIKLKKFRGIGIVHPKTLSWTFPAYLKKSR